MRRILTTIIGFGPDLRFYNSTKIKEALSKALDSVMPNLVWHLNPLIMRS
jgi:hypothetical protein